MDMHKPRALEPAKSPWGENDQIGRLNWVTDESRAAVMAAIDPARSYNLAVPYFMGMPSFQAAGDPTYQIWMTHTPQGNVNDELLGGVTPEGKGLIGYSGDAIQLYTHTGTHIDGLNHFGYRGAIWNGFNQQDDLGSRHWTRCGVDGFPLIIARALLLDVAGYKGVDCLPDSYAIGPEELEAVLKAEGVAVQKGDVVMIRTGRMTKWPDQSSYADNSPGLNLEGAQYLLGQGAMILAADNIGVEMGPSPEKDNYFPVHAYVFAEVGATLLELLWLEDLAKDKVYECGIFANTMPLVGATGAPVQPFVFPYKKK